MQTFGRLAPNLNQLLLPSRTLYSDMALLEPVRAPDGWGVFASIGPNFRHTVFGRDSIEVAEDIYMYDQRVAHDIIFTLARLQGTSYGSQSEEEPGKIHHEYRTTNFANTAVPEHCVGIMRKLQEMWGDTTQDTMLYYGSYDATPLYLRLLQKYTTQYGDEILSETYLDKDGTSKTIRESAHAATNWLVGKLNQREDCLLAYRRSNPRGIENQVWKDSRTAYLFSDGTLPDHAHDIVSTELQGYAYDALVFAAHTFLDRAEELTVLAERVQRSTIEKLWMPDKQFFAQGLGTHQSGEERVLDTLTTNGALLLDSNILKDLPDWPREMFVDSIERTILSADFLTSAGVRCRAAQHGKLLPFVDYHGSYAVWAKETSDIARGLENYGRSGAITLRRALISSFRTAGEFYELFYVDLDGTTYYDQPAAIAHFSSDNMGEPLPVPEPGQAWSISAAITSSHILTKNRKRLSFPRVMQKVREQPIWRSPKTRMPKVSQLISSAQAALARRTK